MNVDLTLEFNLPDHFNTQGDSILDYEITKSSSNSFLFDNKTLGIMIREICRILLRVDLCLVGR